MKLRNWIKCLIEKLKLKNNYERKNQMKSKSTSGNLKKKKNLLGNLHRDIQEIIDDTLKRISMYSPEASLMVFNTGLVESGYRALMQYPSKIARSYFQVEPNTCYDIFENYLKYRKSTWYDVIDVCELNEKYKQSIPTKQECVRLLTNNIAFAICMSRLVYRRVPTKLPRVDDLDGQAHYWLKNYNAGGKGNIDKFSEALKLAS
tara:strand:- start:10126 stop:10737 length:612 start_codon:yes stop_codon:yes gene_type:complete